MMLVHFPLWLFSILLLLSCSRDTTIIAAGHSSSDNGSTETGSDTSSTSAPDTDSGSDTGTETGSDTSSISDTNTGSDSDTGTETESDSSSSCSPPQLAGWAGEDAYGIASTTGGGAAMPERVTEVDVAKRLAADPTPRVIELEGTFNMSLSVASNKTIRGIGKDTTIIGGIDIVGAGSDNNISNVIIQNLNIQGNGPGGTPTDAVAVRYAHHVWIDHCNVWDAPTGNLDITRGATYVTVSWTKFWYSISNSNHSSLVGGSSEHSATDTGKLDTTWHHNWFAENVYMAMPRALYGRSHIYNSYFNSSDNYYCIGAGSGGAVLIENNYFKDVRAPHMFADNGIPANITAKGNEYDSTNSDQTVGGDGDTFDNPPYNYTLDPAGDVPELVQRCTGPQ